MPIEKSRRHASMVGGGSGDQKYAAPLIGREEVEEHHVISRRV